MKVIGRKAEWLKGDGAAWIRYNENIYNVTLRITQEAIDTKKKFNVARYERTETMQFYWEFNCFDFAEGRIYVYAHNSSYKYYIPSTIINTNVIEITEDTYTINGVVKNIDETHSDRPSKYLLNITGMINQYNTAGRYIEISKVNSLTPIQLTSDLPAYLASDNLPHAAGECGMWDSISEKFYGNANSSGEFSVENELDEYIEVDLTGIAINGKYQRVAVENTEIPQIVWNGKEVRALMLNGKVVWSDGILVGKRYEYLVFNSSLKSTDLCDIPTIKQWPRYFRLQIKHSWNQQQYVTLWQAGNFRLYKPSSSYALYYPNGSYTGQFTISGQLNFDCVINNEDGTCEGYIGSKQLSIAKFGSVTGTLFVLRKVNNWRNSGWVGDIILTDLDTNEVIHHFVPCVLSVDINAEMSILDKSHSAGEVGMWDLITKKFTANSKEFDIVNAINEKGFIMR